MNPIISIIIPVYNVEKYLHQCLDSILKQTFQDWECILINDGSSDKSGEICDEYAQRDSRFKVIHKTNRGVSSARNTGLDEAKGQWICFVDSDDRMTEDALEYMLGVNTSTEADVCICTLVKSGLHTFDRTILTGQELEELIWACLTYQTDRYSQKGLLVDGPCAKLFRASIIKDNNIRYVNGLCKSEDALFTAEYYCFASCVVLDPLQIYFYTVNPNSICHTYNKSHICMLGTLLKLEDELVRKYLSSLAKFENVIKIRAFTALLQVLFESNAHRRPLKERIDALRLFFSSREVDSIIKSTQYTEIKPYAPIGIGYFEYLWVKKHSFRLLCRSIDMRLKIFNARMRMVAGLKKLLGISPDMPLSSIILKR